MLKTFQKSVLIHAVILFASGSVLAAAPSVTQKAWHKDLNCSVCHAGGEAKAYQAPQTAQCLTCHVSAEEVAKRTAKLDALQLNPHDNYHYGKNADCVFCHREHQKSYEACNQCHDFRKWVKPVP